MSSSPASDSDRVAERPWTGRTGDAAGETSSSERVSPHGPSRAVQSQSTYAASWINVFGVATIAALALVVVSGAVLALKGSAWWHHASVGHFFNSIHLWSVELFFLCMSVHLWGKFWMAAWRGGRTRVWVTGAVGFLAAVPTALTGYLSQQNFDAQWIATKARNGLNAIGVGAFFNVTDFGQMYSWHVLLLPLALVLLVVSHVLLARRHGPAPPPLEREGLAISSAASGASPSPTGVDAASS